MGLMPVGERRRNRPSTGTVRPRLGDGSAGSLGLEVAPMIATQAVFMILGSIVGILGVILPHPEEFLVPELLTLNFASIALALVVWALASRITETTARITPAVGTVAVTVAVIFSRDPTSAYALLYLFPAVYSFYFLRPRDSALHIIFAVINYAAAIWILGEIDSATPVTSGSVFHHMVITVGNMVMVGAMLVFLRSRVGALIEEVIESARTDLATGLLNTRGLAEVLGAELERARMGAHRVSLLTIQVAGILDVRAKRGDREAERILAEVGQLLDDSTRRIDAVSRTGASEFSVALPETDESTGFLLAEQILARFRRAYREWDVPMSSSIGVATFPKHAATSEALTHSASAASEAAKSLGGDRAVVYSVELEDVLGGDPTRGLTERRTHLSTVLSLAEVLDLRDARTAAHSLAVSRYCELIGAELKVPEQRIQRLRLAGMVHDIGKVGIPDAILDKPGPLAPEEWDQVRRHPEMAARILGARELTDIREWILARHEQPDGHGYPRGLRGDAIPLESRILAVAEAFDAMTSERPYRPAKSSEEAIAELGRYAGSQFDGAVVDALVRALETVDSGAASV